MARNQVAMEAKLLAALNAQVSVSVTELCAQLGISRQTFYKYRRRFEREGPAGLVERSRRPLRSPQLMSAELEDEIVRLRKELPLDCGARSIVFHLQRRGVDPVPSPATVHRALRRRGMVIDQPHKAPPSKGHRFEFALANGAWQIDATQWALVGGETVWVMDVLDDHSRMLIAAVACHGPTAAAAWAAFSAGVARFGLPARVMSDNGACFTARFRTTGGEADFERNLRSLGIEHRLSSPGHPQTCGKLERQHQTLKAWLAPRPAATLTELQAHLDNYQHFYNHDRPHSSLAGATPFERWTNADKDHPRDPIDAAPRAALRIVSAHGRINWDAYQIGIGTDHADHELLVIARDLDVTIYGHTGQVRQLTIDPTRRYQPSGRPVGRPPRHRT
jgi:transposase InsO family protein